MYETGWQSFFRFPFNLVSSTKKGTTLALLIWRARVYDYFRGIFWLGIQRIHTSICNLQWPFTLSFQVLPALKEPSNITFHGPASWQIYQICLPHESCLVELPVQGYTHFSPSSILVKMVSIGIWGLWLSCRLRQQTLFDLLSCRPIKNYN